MTDVTTPAAAPDTYFANTPDASQARHAKFAASVAQLEAAMPPATVAPSAHGTAEVTPNAADLERLDLTRKTIFNGKPAALDPRAKAVIERAHAAVLEGKPLDVTAVKAELHKALGLPPPAAPAEPAAPIEPQGSPDDRAFEAVVSRLDAGEFLSVAEVPAELLAGYIVELPEGFGLNGESISMLQTAKAAGIPQSAVDAFIRARIAQESEQ